MKVGARVFYHAKRWHVHIASAFSLARCYRTYSLDPATPRGEGQINQLWRAVCGKSQIPVPLTFELRIPVGYRTLFPVSGAQLMLFGAKTRPENAVGMHGTEVGSG